MHLSALCLVAVTHLCAPLVLKKSFTPILASGHTSSIFPSSIQLAVDQYDPTETIELALKFQNLDQNGEELLADYYKNGSSLNKPKTSNKYLPIEPSVLKASVENDTLTLDISWHFRTPHRACIVYLEKITNDIRELNKAPALYCYEKTISCQGKCSPIISSTPFWASYWFEAERVNAQSRSIAHVYADNTAPSAAETSTMTIQDQTMADDSQLPLFRAFQQMLVASNIDANIIWVAYNDQPPKNKAIRTIYTPKSDAAPGSLEHYGHLKGFFLFDTNSLSGFWITHSLPEFPVVVYEKQVPILADNVQKNFGKISQHSMCMAISDLSAFSRVLDQVAVMNPFIYGWSANLVDRLAKLGTDSVYSMVYEKLVASKECDKALGIKLPQSGFSQVLAMLLPRGVINRKLSANFTVQSLLCTAQELFLSFYASETKALKPLSLIYDAVNLALQETQGLSDLDCKYYDYENPLYSSNKFLIQLYCGLKTLNSNFKNYSNQLFELKQDYCISTHEFQLSKETPAQADVLIAHFAKTAAASVDIFDYIVRFTEYGKNEALMRQSLFTTSWSTQYHDRSLTNLVGRGPLNMYSFKLLTATPQVVHRTHAKIGFFGNIKNTKGFDSPFKLDSDPSLFATTVAPTNYNLVVLSDLNRGKPPVKVSHISKLFRPAQGSEPATKRQRLFAEPLPALSFSPMKLGHVDEYDYEYASLLTDTPLFAKSEARTNVDFGPIPMDDLDTSLSPKDLDLGVLYLTLCIELPRTLKRKPSFKTDRLASRHRQESGADDSEDKDYQERDRVGHLKVNLTHEMEMLTGDKQKNHIMRLVFKGRAGGAFLVRNQQFYNWISKVEPVLQSGAPKFTPLFSERDKARLGSLRQPAAGPGEGALLGAEPSPVRRVSTADSMQWSQYTADRNLQEWVPKSQTAEPATPYTAGLKRSIIT